MPVEKHVSLGTGHHDARVMTQGDGLNRGINVDDFLQTEFLQVPEPHTVRSSPPETMTACPPRWPTATA